MCSCHSVAECCVMFSGVKLSMGSFVLFQYKLALSKISFFFSQKTISACGSGKLVQPLSLQNLPESHPNFSFPKKFFGLQQR